MKRAKAHADGGGPSDLERDSDSKVPLEGSSTDTTVELPPLAPPSALGGRELCSWAARLMEGRVGPRSSSLRAVEKLLVVVDTLQIFGLLWATSLAWPWPYQVSVRSVAFQQHAPSKRHFSSPPIRDTNQP